jgi:hypothetical protein
MDGICDVVPLWVESPELADTPDPRSQCTCVCAGRFAREDQCEIHHTKEKLMTEFKQYRRSQIAEMADWEPGFDMTRVSLTEADREAGSPKVGDKIARNPKNHDDRWLVAAAYFAENFEPVENSV